MGVYLNFGIRILLLYFNWDL